MASNSCCSRSAGSQGSIVGRRIASRAAGPPNENCSAPLSIASCARCATASMESTAAETRARFASSASKAPAAARLSSTRLLTARGLIRLAKSERSANGLPPRAATIASTAVRPTPLSAASA